MGGQCWLKGRSCHHYDAAGPGRDVGGGGKECGALGMLLVEERKADQLSFKDRLINEAEQATARWPTAATNADNAPLDHRLSASQLAGQVSLLPPARSGDKNEPLTRKAPNDEPQAIGKPQGFPDAWRLSL